MSVLRCRVCGGVLDSASVSAGLSVHRLDPFSLDTDIPPGGLSRAATSMVARQRAACVAGRRAAAGTTPAGTWLLGGTGTGEPYPCRCAEADEWTHAHGRCPCAGRTDTAGLPESCCMWTAPAAPVPPVSTLDELHAVLIDYELSRPRSTQKTLGPSELGTACLAQLARKIAGLPRREPTVPPWAPFIGTAVHAQMEQVLRHWNDTVGWQRFIIEDELSIGDGVTGHGDAFDIESNMVIDWKSTGVTALKKLAAARTAGLPVSKQVSQDYRVQAHLYGMGHALKGRRVEWVRLVLLARTWQFSDSAEWTEPYQPDVAAWALKRLTDTQTLVDTLGVVHTPDLIAAVPRTTGGCMFCPFHHPGGPNNGDGCPGDESATTEAVRRFSAGLL